MIRTLVILLASGVAISQSQTAKDPCAPQKAEVDRLEQWVSYDRQHQNATLATNQAKLAVANASLKQCRGHDPTVANILKLMVTGNSSGSASLIGLEQADSSIMAFHVEYRSPEIDADIWHRRDGSSLPGDAKFRNGSPLLEHWKPI